MVLNNCNKNVSQLPLVYSGSRLPSISKHAESPRTNVSVSPYFGKIEIQIVEK